MKILRWLFLAACAAVALQSVSHAGLTAGQVDPSNTPYTKTVKPLGNGWGIARITTTEDSTDAAYDYRYVSAGAIGSAKSIGGQPELYKVFGAQLGFGTNGAYTDNDVTGFYFTFDPLAPDTLSVWRNWVYTSARPDALHASAGLTDVGLGGVSRDGTISVRVDGYGGGTSGSAIGALNGASTATSPTKLYTFASITGQWELMAGGSTCTDVVSPPGIGDTDNVQAYSSFANFLAACRSTFSPSGSACNNVHAVNIVTGNHRGLLAVSSGARKAAMYAKLGADASDQVSAVRYISYTCNPPYSSFSSTSTVYDFSGAIPGKVCSGTDFFSSNPYRGPAQVAINDLGDIAFPVVITDPGAVSWRAVPQRAILFMDHSTPGAFKVVCRNDDGSCAPLLFYDPITPFSPTYCVAIDNDKNVYFTYTNWMGTWGGGIKSTTMICKAKADSTQSPTKWSVSPIVWLGQQWHDTEDDTTYTISILPHYNGSTEYFASPAAFSGKSINRTPVLGNSIGGMLISAGLGYDDPNAVGTRMAACYVAPTQSQASASDIASAKLLADDEGVNLYGLAVVSCEPDYTDNYGNTWAQYTVRDRSGMILVQSIRSNLKPGDLLNVSGSMKTNEVSGARLIHSTGLVLVDRKPYGVSNKAASTDGALVGKWVKVWGKVSNSDSVSRSFTLDDGSGAPVMVDYNQAGSSVTAPADGAYVSATGRIEMGGMLSMEYGARIQ